MEMIFRAYTTCVQWIVGYKQVFSRQVCKLRRGRFCGLSVDLLIKLQWFKDSAVFFSKPTNDRWLRFLEVNIKVTKG